MQNIYKNFQIRERNPRKAIERSSAALSEKTQRALESTTKALFFRSRWCSSPPDLFISKFF